jgi:FtsP/CotA-like multicopper oxidase with cupredoxin domain
MKVINRRQFLQMLGYGAVSIAGSKFLSACSAFSAAQSTPVFVGDPDVEIRLTAKPEEQQILPGSPTRVWRYQAEVLKGPAESILTIPDSYMGPIFNLRKGTNLRVHFINDVPQETIIHWHGLHVPEHADGHPRFVIEQGETYEYNFTVMDRAGTYWYHPHPHGITGPQVYQGLAGLFLVHDEEEDSLSLPNENQDLPIVIQDRVFDDDNQLVYEPKVLGMFGDRILVNGQPDYKFTVNRGAYRLRLLNGSNARIYKLAWEDGTPLQVIGTEGGLLEKPITRDYITMAPAQRLDLWVDFSKWDAGETISMVNLSSAAIGGEESYPIFSADVQDASQETAALPKSFPTHDVFDPGRAVNANSPRVFELGMGMGMQWMINGRTFEMTDVARDERVRLGDTEIWEFFNTGGMGMGMMGMGMAQAHPMHIHGLQFKVLEREIEAGDGAVYESLKDGIVDEGWHDTVLVNPGERVRLVMKFEDFNGLYLYHCHNLEHEDMGMMRNYEIVESL